MIRKIKHILIILGIALLSVQNTSAFFVDTETSALNTFTAGSLDFELTNLDDSAISGYVIDGVNMIPGGETSGAVKINKLGSLDFEYGITASHMSGNGSLFNVLDVSVSVDSIIKYTGKLSSIVLSPIPIITDSTDNIDITVTLPSGSGSSLQLLGCEFEFVVHGDQVGPTVGFWDEESFMGRVSTSDWTPPIMSHMMLASPGVGNGIVVTWNTDELATSDVQIGTTIGYGLVFPITPDPTADSTSHSVTLSGLSLYTTYHMRAVSTDQYGNTSYSDDMEFIIKPDWFEFIPRGDIVINEILPNPIGLDDALRPGGEWVELYNKGGSSLNVAGWKLCSFGQCINISSLNTMSGLTTIAPGGFMVVYFEDSYPGGILSNSGLDYVSLYNSSWGIRDLHWFWGTQEGKSIVRYPDGANMWYDPIPSPGLPNNLDPVVPEEEEEEIIIIEEVVDEE